MSKLNNFTDETFLARWLNNDLSEVELKAFEKADDFYIYKRIAETAHLLKKPEFDKEKAFQKVLQTRMKTKRKQVIPLWSYWLAASVALLIGIFNLLPSESVYKSLRGEQLAFHLPDESMVRLNSESEIVFQSSDWNTTRELELKGEAYFKVKSGSKFTVNTRRGCVSVLGTEFNVHARDRYFEVCCYEGEVEVKFKRDLIRLKEGAAIRFIDEEKESWNFSQKQPAWLSGESSFENMPVKEVMNALQRQYNIRFEYRTLNLNRRFTGSFTHDNLELALKTVFYPMDIKYKLRANMSILLYSK